MMGRIKDNGFTLIEIIVVIAILAILSTGMLAGFGSLNLANFKKAAGKIDNEISDCRGVCMSHEEPAYVYIYNRGGSIYVLTTATGNYDFSGLEGSNGEKIASSRVKISYMEDGGAAYTELAPGNYIQMSFRMNGAFREGAPAGAPAANNTKFYKKIKIEGNGGTREISMTQMTGKHYMKR